MDDATSEIYYARFVEEENTESVMGALRAVVQKQGVFCSLYSDRASHFVVTPRAIRAEAQQAVQRDGRGGRNAFVPHSGWTWTRSFPNSANAWCPTTTW
jgi:hypothetical protein